MVSLRVDFAPDVKARLAAEGANFPDGFKQDLPLGLWPAPGDLWADARVSPRTFIVVNRIFSWDSEGNVLHQVLLGLSPTDHVPLETLRNVVPLPRAAASIS
jgi:hypothetical protein